jgi:Tfp pilus assembly protein PilX
MNPSVESRNRIRQERGVALFLALTAAALLTAIGASLLIAVSTETLIVGSGRAGDEALYAADAALARTIHDLAALPDWSAVLSSPSPSASYDDGAAVAVMPDGRSRSVASLAAQRQAVSDAGGGAARFGADRPVWRVFGHAPLSRVLPPGLAAQPAYILALVGDDGLDGDGDSATDANGRLLVYVEAFGVAGARRGIEAVLSHAGPQVVRVVSWREAR